MNFYIITCLLLSITNSQIKSVNISSWIELSVGGSADSGMVIGYDYLNDQINIIGGIKHEATLSYFDLDSGIYSDSSGTHNVVVRSQAYAQSFNSSIVYYDNSGSLASVTSANIENQPTTFGVTRILLTNTDDVIENPAFCINEDESILYIIGLRVGDQNSIVRELDINGGCSGNACFKTWTNLLPYPSRRRASCKVYGDGIYVFGGTVNRTDTTLNEIILCNITTESCTKLLTNAMVEARANIQTVRIDNACSAYLVLIGGYTDGDVPTSTVEVFNMDTNQIYQVASLNTPRNLAAAFYSRWNGRIWVFYGLNSTDLNSPLSTIEVTPLTNELSCTFSPTVDPTVYPTVMPTIDPTYDPTTDPTIEPTTNPTVIPTNNPTSIPTILPTSDPTSQPTKYPTSIPTIYPTSEPTSDPIQVPTINPTLYPTTEPTTLIPTYSLQPTTKTPTSGSAEVTEYTTTNAEEIIEEPVFGNLDWWWYLILSLLVLFCCCCLFIFCFYRKKKKQGYDTTKRLNESNTLSRAGASTHTSNYATPKNDTLATLAMVTAPIPDDDDDVLPDDEPGIELGMKSTSSLYAQTDFPVVTKGQTSIDLPPEEWDDDNGDNNYPSQKVGHGAVIMGTTSMVDPDELIPPQQQMDHDDDDSDHDVIYEGDVVTKGADGGDNILLQKSVSLNIEGKARIRDGDPAVTGGNTANGDVNVNVQPLSNIMKSMSDSEKLYSSQDNVINNNPLIPDINDNDDNSSDDDGVMYDKGKKGATGGPKPKPKSKSKSPMFGKKKSVKIKDESSDDDDDDLLYANKNKNKSKGGPQSPKQLAKIKSTDANDNGEKSKGGPSNNDDIQLQISGDHDNDNNDADTDDEMYSNNNDDDLGANTVINSGENKNKIKYGDPVVTNGQNDTSEDDDSDGDIVYGV